MDTLKVCVVGDGAVGKTCLLVSYTTGQAPGDYVPTVFDNYSANVDVDGQCHSLSLWDTAGQEDYDRLRPLSYPQTDVFIVCYSVTCKISLQNAQTKWIPELRAFAPDAPIMLVGTKIDLRDDPKSVAELSLQGKGPVSSTDGLDVSRTLNLPAWAECSSMTLNGLDNVFKLAAKAALDHRNNKRKGQGRSSCQRFNPCSVM